MGFEKSDEKKGNAQKRLAEMTYADLDAALTGLSQTLKFEAGGSSPRMNRNYMYLAKWADMSMEEYTSEKSAAKSSNVTIQVYSGAYTKDGAIRMPVKEDGNYLSPTLAHILDMQDERLSRITYAKKKEVEDFSKGAEDSAFQG